MKRVVLVLLLAAAAGCGDVTETPLVAADGGAGGAPVGDVVQRPATAVSSDGPPAEQTGAPDAQQAAPDAGAPSDGGHSCAPAAGCSSCTQAGPTGPGYATAQQCAEVIGCVLSGDAGAYPWQSCHNIATGGGAQWGGLACAQALVKACPQ